MKLMRGKSISGLTRSLETAVLDMTATAGKISTIRNPDGDVVGSIANMLSVAKTYTDTAVEDFDPEQIQINKDAVSLLNDTDAAVVGSIANSSAEALAAATRDGLIPERIMAIQMPTNKNEVEISKIQCGTRGRNGPVEIARDLGYVIHLDYLNGVRDMSYKMMNDILASSHVSISQEQKLSFGPNDTIVDSPLKVKMGQGSDFVNTPLTNGGYIRLEIIGVDASDPKILILNRAYPIITYDDGGMWNSQWWGGGMMMMPVQCTDVVGPNLRFTLPYEHIHDSEIGQIERSGSHFHIVFTQDAYMSSVAHEFAKVIGEAGTSVDYLEPVQCYEFKAGQKANFTVTEITNRILKFKLDCIIGVDKTQYTRDAVILERDIEIEDGTTGMVVTVPSIYEQNWLELGVRGGVTRVEISHFMGMESDILFTGDAEGERLVRLISGPKIFEPGTYYFKFESVNGSNHIVSEVVYDREILPDMPLPCSSNSILGKFAVLLHGADGLLDTVKELGDATLENIEEQAIIEATRAANKLAVETALNDQVQIYVEGNSVVDARFVTERAITDATITEGIAAYDVIAMGKFLKIADVLNDYSSEDDKLSARNGLGLLSSDDFLALYDSKKDVYVSRAYTVVAGSVKLGPDVTVADIKWIRKYYPGGEYDDISIEASSVGKFFANLYTAGDLDGDDVNVRFVQRTV